MQGFCSLSNYDIGKTGLIGLERNDEKKIEDILTL